MSNEQKSTDSSTKPDGTPFDAEFVCRAVCAECPFRAYGKRRVDISHAAAQRIVRDITERGVTFPCHLTSTPNGLGTELADKADWRFCAGAYLTMNEEERRANGTLRLVKRMGYQKSMPVGKSLVFNNLNAFVRHYGELTVAERQRSKRLP